jgi:hypothetical protein
MLNKIKDFFFVNKVKKVFTLREPIREKDLIAFKDIKKILILFDTTEENECRYIFNIVQELQEDGKNVRAVGYVPWKKNPHYCFPKLSFDYINLSKINFFGIPTSIFAPEITDSRFDLLIDFTNHDIKPMIYFSSLSNSGIKISKKHTNNQYNIFTPDIVIDKENLSNKDFFFEVKKYLQLLINKK